MADMAWLGEDPPDSGERGARRKGAALVLVGLTLVAAVAAVVAILTDRGQDTPVSHRGDQTDQRQPPDSNAALARQGMTQLLKTRSQAAVG
jgi:hypothetical protein